MSEGRVALKTQGGQADTQSGPPPRKAHVPHLLLTLALAMFAGSAPTGPATQPAPVAPVSLARVEIKIQTTSDWSSVSIRPGRVGAQQIITRPSDVTVAPFATGWTLGAPGGVLRTVVVRAVLEDRTSSDTFGVTVQKGRLGATRVEVTNTSGSPFAAALVVNNAPHDGTGNPDGPFVVTVSRTREQLYGSTPLIVPRADPVRRVLAFYYPWFDQAAYAKPELVDRPSDPTAGIGRMSRQAREAGIDGFIVSYEGETQTGKAFDEVLLAAERTGGVATPYLEIRAANAARDLRQPTSIPMVLEWLRAVLRKSSSTAFLRSGGVPVVFIYEMERLGPVAWKRILDQIAADGSAVRLVGDAPMGTFGKVQWGVHTYNPNRFDNLASRYRASMLEAKLLAGPGEPDPHLYAATVSPGFELEPIVERGEGGAHYLDTWNAALGARPDWVLICTWNEWYEGTSVQPSEEHGDLALRQTAEQAERFRSQTG